MSCAAPPQTAPAPVQKEEPPKEERIVLTEGGESTRYAGDGEPRALWLVRWKSAKIEYTDDQHFGGTMQDVSGIIYRDGEAVSEFKANTGIVDKESNLLRLTGNVTITEIVEAGSTIKTRPQRTMISKEIEWDADDGILKASGDVKILLDPGEIGSLEELWATPDLNHVATPDLFKQS